MNEPSDHSPDRPGAEAGAPGPAGQRRRLGLALGPVLFTGMLLLPPPPGLELAGWQVAALATWMAVWWVTEAIPVPATALLPLVVLPATGVADLADATAAFGNPLLFLFLGGFVVALAVARHGLHRRIALAILARTGTRPSRLIGGFMLATAILSMWISNTAAAMMMVPVAASIVSLAGKQESRVPDGLGLALMLGVAWAASIGGLATLVGTPPNAFLAAWLLRTHGIEIGFFRWMLVGVPVSTVLLGIAWLMLCRLPGRGGEAGLPGAAAAIGRARAAAGPFSVAETRIAAIFATVALLWVFRPLLDDWLPLTDPGIALLGALATFIVPAGRPAGGGLLVAGDLRELPWNVLILFGGGLSLAAAMDDSGFAAWVGGALVAWAGWPSLAMLFVVVAAIVFLTEITSNTATAAVFLPVVANFGAGIGEGPLSFAVPAALAASCAFMMPVATPPNAIVFGSGLVALPDMARHGFLLNLLAIPVVVLLARFLVPLLTGG